MEERSKDGFDEIEEDFRKKCLYTDSDNLYLFENGINYKQDKLNAFSSYPNPKGLVVLLYCVVLCCVVV